MAVETGAPAPGVSQAPPALQALQALSARLSDIEGYLRQYGLHDGSNASRYREHEQHLRAPSPKTERPEMSNTGCAEKAGRDPAGGPHRNVQSQPQSTRAWMGVRYRPRQSPSKPFQARITLSANKQKLSVGWFPSGEEAARAVDEAMLKFCIGPLSKEQLWVQYDRHPLNFPLRRYTKAQDLRVQRAAEAYAIVLELRGVCDLGSKASYAMQQAEGSARSAESLVPQRASTCDGARPARAQKRSMGLVPNVGGPEGQPARSLARDGAEGPSAAAGQQEGQPGAPGAGHAGPGPSCRAGQAVGSPPGSPDRPATPNPPPGSFSHPPAHHSHNARTADGMCGSRGRLEADKSHEKGAAFGANKRGRTDSGCCDEHIRKRHASQEDTDSACRREAAFADVHERRCKHAKPGLATSKVHQTCSGLRGTGCPASQATASTPHASDAAGVPASTRPGEALNRGGPAQAPVATAPRPGPAARIELEKSAVRGAGTALDPVCFASDSDEDLVGNAARTPGRGDQQRWGHTQESRQRGDPLAAYKLASWLPGAAGPVDDGELRPLPPRVFNPPSAAAGRTAAAKQPSAPRTAPEDITMVDDSDEDSDIAIIDEVDELGRAACAEQPCTAGAKGLRSGLAGGAAAGGSAAWGAVAGGTQAPWAGWDMKANWHGSQEQAGKTPLGPVWRFGASPPGVGLSDVVDALRAGDPTAGMRTGDTEQDAGARSHVRSSTAHTPPAGGVSSGMDAAGPSSSVAPPHQAAPLRTPRAQAQAADPLIWPSSIPGPAGVFPATATAGCPVPVPRFIPRKQPRLNPTGRDRSTCPPDGSAETAPCVATAQATETSSLGRKGGQRAAAAASSSLGGSPGTLAESLQDRGSLGQPALPPEGSFLAELLGRAPGELQPEVISSDPAAMAGDEAAELRGLVRRAGDGAERAALEAAEWEARRGEVERQNEEARRLKRARRAAAELEQRSQARLEGHRAALVAAESAAAQRERLRVAVRAELEQRTARARSAPALLRALGISAGPSGGTPGKPGAVRAELRRALMGCHPDRHAGADVAVQVRAEEVFKVLSQALADLDKA